MLKFESLGLLEGKEKTLIPSDIFLSVVEELEGVLDFFTIFLETHFLGNILHHPPLGCSAVQLSGSLAWEDDAEVVVHKPRVEDPTFLFLPFPRRSCSLHGGGHFASS